MSDLLPRKWRLRVGKHHNVFAKGFNESAEHVLMKILIWALYLPQYPDLRVEYRFGDRYKPDIVALNEHSEPLFWGESGQVSASKIRSIARRFPNTHFAISKWNTGLEQHAQHIKRQLEGLKRQAPFDLLGFPENSRKRFIQDDNTVHIRFEDIEWIRLS